MMTYNDMRQRLDTSLFGASPDLLEISGRRNAAAGRTIHDPRAFSRGGIVSDGLLMTLQAQGRPYDTLSAGELADLEYRGTFPEMEREPFPRIQGISSWLTSTWADKPQMVTFPNSMAASAVLGRPLTKKMEWLKGDQHLYIDASAYAGNARELEVDLYSEAVANLGMNRVMPTAQMKGQALLDGAMHLMPDHLINGDWDDEDDLAYRFADWLGRNRAGDFVDQARDYGQSITKDVQQFAGYKVRPDVAGEAAHRAFIDYSDPERQVAPDSRYERYFKP